MIIIPISGCFRLVFAWRGLINLTSGCSINWLCSFNKRDYDKFCSRLVGGMVRDGRIQHVLVSWYPCEHLRNRTKALHIFQRVSMIILMRDEVEDHHAKCLFCFGNFVFTWATACILKHRALFTLAHTWTDYRWRTNIAWIIYSIWTTPAEMRRQERAQSNA